MDEIRRRLDEFKAASRRAGVKITHQRLVICEAVLRAQDHPDAEAVHTAVRAQMPTVSLDTVYRTLWLLCDLGLVTTVGLQRERLRFDGNRRPHHHFICIRCGAAQDFYSDQLDQLSLPADVHAFGQVQAVQVEARGVCQRCGQDSAPRRPDTFREEDT